VFARRDVWLAMLVLVATHPTPALATEGDMNERMHMSFARVCKRSASDVMGTLTRDFRDRSETKAPRASSEFPLQQPAHPTKALDKQGTVVLAIFITEAGLVSEVYVSQSSSSPELDRAAMKITERWRLQPGTVNGVPVCMWGKYAVVFGERASRVQSILPKPIGPTLEATPKHDETDQAHREDPER